jgi:hypothetical protein
MVRRRFLSLRKYYPGEKPASKSLYQACIRDPMTHLPVNNPDSAVEREVMSKEQTFRSEDMPFGIANGKLWQISNSNMESAICDLKFRVLARTCCSRLAPRSLFNCGIRVMKFCRTVLAGADEIIGDNDLRRTRVFARVEQALGR